MTRDPVHRKGKIMGGFGLVSWSAGLGWSPEVPSENQDDIFYPQMAQMSADEKRDFLWMKPDR